jgi:hypothetical protein
MSVRSQVAVFPVLLLAGFALRYPWRAEPSLPFRPMPPAVTLVSVAVASIAAGAPGPEDADASAAANGEYAGATLRQFAAEPALLDLIEDQASDPDVEVRDEASAVLDLGSSTFP